MPALRRLAGPVAALATAAIVTPVAHAAKSHAFRATYSGHGSGAVSGTRAAGHATARGRGSIIGRSTRNAVEMERHNANYVGGDINGGVQDIGQLFTRPAVQFPPYVIPAKGLYICSSATPPGGGVHGMCGFHAAQAALKRSFAK